MRIILLSTTLFAGLLYWATGKVANADVNLSSPTPGASVSVCRVRSVHLDYDSQTATVYYGYVDSNGGYTTQGGSFSIPFPNPTPGVLGTIKMAAEKTIAGYSAGSLSTATPIAVGTVTP